MRCRQIVNGEVVWFNSQGKSLNNKAIKADNFAKDADAVAQILTQNLSILEGELWDDILYGLPLINNQKSKLTFDSFIISVIESKPEIESIVKFESMIDKNTYRANFIVSTIYGKLEISI